ncbi:radical SAM protein [bacterium]|nr:radical SAM protein [bacterium]
MALLEKIKNKKKLLLEAPDPRRIYYLNFAVTYLCNSRCKHCNIWKRYKENPEEYKLELNLKEIEEMFEKSQYLRNLIGIGLTGGEPFLRKDFVDLCGFFIKKYPKAAITIPTNAVNPELVVNKLEEIIRMYDPRLGSIYISISLDGIGSTHDNIRGVLGNYNKVLKLIELLKKVTPSINLGVSFTITPQNYKDLIDVYKFSREKNIGFGVQFAQTSEMFYGNIEKQFGWDKKKLDKVDNMIDSIIRDYIIKRKPLQKIFSVDIYYLSHMVHFMKKPHVISRCYSGIHSFFMDPYGNIYPCVMLNKKIGNIRDSNFDELWLSEQAQKVRKFIKSKMCACWTPCEACPSLAREPKITLWNFYNTLLFRMKKN